MRYSNVGEFLCPTMESGKIISIFSHLACKITICVWAYASLVMSHMQQLVIKKRCFGCCGYYVKTTPMLYLKTTPMLYLKTTPMFYVSLGGHFQWLPFMPHM